MPTKWKRGEWGPRCSCGEPTNLVATADGTKWFAICLFHHKDYSASIEMPPEKPDGFEPYIPDDDEDDEVLGEEPDDE